MMRSTRVVFAIFLVLSVFSSHISAENEEESSSDLYVIEGKVFPWENTGHTRWQLMTHVMANGGEYYGFLK